MSERTWYLNSERPVTDEIAKKGILCTWLRDGKMKKPERFDYIPNGMSHLSAYWMPDEWPQPPKPREKSQAEQDFELMMALKRHGWINADQDIEAFVVRIRADQEAKTTERYKAILERAEEVTLNAVAYVGRANYAEREAEAMKSVRDFFANPTAHRPQ